MLQQKVIEIKIGYDISSFINMDFLRPSLIAQIAEDSNEEGYTELRDACFKALDDHDDVESIVEFFNDGDTIQAYRAFVAAKED